MKTHLYVGIIGLILVLAPAAFAKDPQNCSDRKDHVPLRINLETEAKYFPDFKVIKKIDEDMHDYVLLTSKSDSAADKKKLFEKGEFTGDLEARCKAWATERKRILGKPYLMDVAGAKEAYVPVRSPLQKLFTETDEVRAHLAKSCVTDPDQPPADPAAVNQCVCKNHDFLTKKKSELVAMTTKYEVEGLRLETLIQEPGESLPAVKFFDGKVLAAMTCRK